MFDYEGIKNLNERIIEQSITKVSTALDNSQWDCECFEVMSQSIDNLLDLEKINKYNSEKQMVTVGVMKKDAKTETTDFEQLVYDIMDNYTDNPYIYNKVIEVIAETMEDMRILHKRMYDNTMTKLKGMIN